MAKALKRLMREGLDILEIRELEREDSQTVCRGVVLELVERCACLCGIARSEDKLIGLRFSEKLPDGFETLSRWCQDMRRPAVVWQPTKPDDAPVATIVFATTDMDQREKRLWLTLI